MRYIGIDLGTSYIKGAVLNLETLSIGSARAGHFRAGGDGTPSPGSGADIVKNIMHTVKG
jgi:sugar (pentulose or hexulose) kinase